MALSWRCIHNVAIHNVDVHNVAGDILNFFLFIFGDILNYGGNIMILPFDIINVHFLNSDLHSFLIGFCIGPPKMHGGFRIGLSKIHGRFRIGPPKIHRGFRIGPP